MNQEVKKKWVEALRSGMYKQGRGFLRPGKDTYCCLGVLCDLHDNTRWLTLQVGCSYVGNTQLLPGCVVSWAELADNNPDIKGEYLAEMNDDGKTFAEIADIIERAL